MPREQMKDLMEFPKGSRPWVLANTPLIGFKRDADWEAEDGQPSNDDEA